jgi:hypothetical protein
LITRIDSYDDQLIGCKLRVPFARKRAWYGAPNENPKIRRDRTASRNNE